MTVIRVRRTPGGKDENGDTIPSIETRKPLPPWEIAPGASEEYVALGRNGARVDWTVFYRLRTDLTNDDLLEIAGDEYRIRVLPWQSRRSRRGGLVVLASRKEG